MERRRRNKYYTQIITALLIVNLCPMLFLGASIVGLIRRQTGQMYSSLQDSVENERNQLEVIFRYTDAALLRLSLNERISGAVGREMQAAGFREFYAVQEELTMVSSQEESVRNVYLLSFDRNWIIGPTFMRSMTETEKEKIRQFWNIPENSFWLDEGDTLWLCVRTPLFYFDGGGMLAAEFGKNELLQRTEAQEAMYPFLVLGEDGRCILESGSAGIIAEALFGEGFSEESFGGGRIRAGGESWVLAKTRSAYNGWEYVIAASVSGLNRSMARVFFSLTVSVLFMLVFSISVIRMLSRRLYSPIREIDRTLRKSPDVSGEGGELLENLQELIKKNAGMRKELLTGRENAVQLFLQKVYMGDFTKLTGEDFLENGIVLPEVRSVFYVLLIRYAAEFDTDEDEQLYRFILNNIIEELVDPGERLEPVFIHRIMYVTCIMPDRVQANTAVRLETVANLVFNTLRSCVDVPVSIGVSGKIYDLSDLPKGVTEAENALKDIIGADGGILFYSRQKREYITAADSKVRQLRLRILKSLEDGDREACEEYTVCYTEKLRELKYHQMKLELYALVSEVLNVYTAWALPPDYEKITDIMDFGTLHKMKAFESLEILLREHLLSPLLEQAEGKQGQNLIGRITEYLNENIESDISLEQCAEKFSYNASYLSRMFRQKFGKTYTEYVVEKKMERCKELLLETDISVNDLASRFGYSSPQNFIRVFKKYTLMTPGQFRKSNTQNT